VPAPGASRHARESGQGLEGGLVRVELVHVLYGAERPAHLLDDLHVFQRRLQRFSGGVHGFDRRLTGRLGRGSCLLTGDPRALPGFPEALSLLPDDLERPTVLVADLP
jgi:hypothetical protein